MSILCFHKFVDGFGGMGDALVCAKCGLDKYPEAILIERTVAALTGNIIREDHPEYTAWAEKARAAREVRRLREDKQDTVA